MGASSHPESNENPITAYEKREDFSFFQSRTRSLWGCYFFQFTIAKRTPLKKIGGAFTVVHATLYGKGMKTHMEPQGSGIWAAYLTFKRDFTIVDLRSSLQQIWIIISLWFCPKYGKGWVPFQWMCDCGIKRRKLLWAIKRWNEVQHFQRIPSGSYVVHLGGVRLNS